MNHTGGRGWGGNLRSGRWSITPFDLKIRTFWGTCWYEFEIGRIYCVETIDIPHGRRWSSVYFILIVFNLMLSEVAYRFHCKSLVSVTNNKLTTTESTWYLLKMIAVPSHTKHRVICTIRKQPKNQLVTSYQTHIVSDWLRLHNHTDALPGINGTNCDQSPP